MKTDLFQSCGHCWIFQICWHIECSTFTASSFRIQNSSTGIPWLPLALFLVMLPKAHLTSHSKMSGSRRVITPSWLSGLWSGCTVLEKLWGDTPHQGQRRSPRKMVGGAKSYLESNPIATRDAQRAQTNLVCTRTQRPHRDWARTVFECLLWRDSQQWTASGAGALDAQTRVWHKPSWRRSPLTPP